MKFYVLRRVTTFHSAKRRIESSSFATEEIKIGKIADLSESSYK